MSLSIQEVFGLRVRDLRKAGGYSQEGFAAACGVHRTYMGSIERGLMNVSLQTLVKIAGKLNLSISELLQGVDAPPKNSSPTASPDPATKRRAGKGAAGKKVSQ